MRYHQPSPIVPIIPHITGLDVIPYITTLFQRFGAPLPPQFKTYGPLRPPNLGVPRPAKFGAAKGDRGHYP